MAERKGFTAPANAAEELQRMMKEERDEAVKPTSLEGSFQPSREDAQEDRKFPSAVQNNEGAKVRRKESVKQPSQEGWKEDVKARAKTGSKEDRKVRLNVDMPAGLHLDMKMWCLREGYNLNEVIPALVAAFLEGEN